MPLESEGCIEARLNRLERSNRRLKGILAILVASLSGCVVLGWKSPDGDVETRHLVLVDDSGRKRIELGMSKGKDPFIGVLDEGGHYRALLMLNEVAELQLNDEFGHSRVELLHGVDTSCLRFDDSTEMTSDGVNPRVLLVAGHDDATRLSIRNRPGAYTISLGSSRTEGMDLSLSDCNGSTSDLRVGIDGKSEIRLLNKQREIIWKAP